MRTFTLALAASALLALGLAATPAAAADPLFHCMVDVWGFHASYDCHILGPGATGSVYWCPGGPIECQESHVLGCSFDAWYGRCW